MVKNQLPEELWQIIITIIILIIYLFIFLKYGLYILLNPPVMLRVKLTQEHHCVCVCVWFIYVYTYSIYTW